MAWLDAVAAHPYKQEGSKTGARISLNTDDADRWTQVWLEFGKNGTLARKTEWLVNFPEWEDWIFLSDPHVLPAAGIDRAIKAALHRDLEGFYQHSSDLLSASLLEFIPAWAFVQALDMMTAESDIKLHAGNARMFVALDDILEPTADEKTLRHAYVTSVIRNSPGLSDWEVAFASVNRSITNRLELLAVKLPLSAFWYALTECMFEEDDDVLQRMIMQWPASIRNSWSIATSMGEDSLLAARNAWSCEGASSAPLQLPDDLHPV